MSLSLDDWRFSSKLVRKKQCITVVISNCHCGYLLAAEAGIGSTAQNHATPAGRYVTLREIEAMTNRSAAVRRLFKDSSTDSRVDRMLLRTGKV